MLVNLYHGLTDLANLDGLLYLFGGSIFGVIFGVIPGLGGVVILSVVLAFIYHISLTGTICIFLALQAASYYSASITSILLNTPAHPEAFAVSFDGFPMAQKGEAGRALGISATATCIGGLVGCVVLVGFIQIINYLPTVFHPPEFVALVLISLLLVGTLGTDRVSKALISVGIGIMLSAIGTDPITAVQRYTLGTVGLISGVSIVGLALGLFAVPQMVLVFGTATTIARQDMMGNDIDAADVIELERGFGKQVIQGIWDALHHWVALIRAGLVGVVTGIIPGIGGFAANFLSYGIAQQTSKKRELFGTGIPEGIIAPEGSSLSKEAGGMVPIVGLGIPGSIGGALFLAALIIKGVRTGYGFTSEYPSLAYEMMWVIALGGIIGTAIGVIFSPLLARVTKVPGPLLVPIILVLSAFGPFVSDVSFFSVGTALIFSFVGFFLRRLRYSIAAFAIGLVLGPTLEDNLYLTHQVFPGFTFLHRWLADVMFAIAILILVVKAVQLRSDERKNFPKITEEDPEVRKQLEAERFLKRNPYPQLALLTSLGIFAFSVWFTFYGMTNYTALTAVFPSIGGIMAAAASAWRVPQEALAYRHYRQVKRDQRQGRIETAQQPQPAMAAASDPPAGTDFLSSVRMQLDEPTLDPAPAPAPAARPALPPVEDKAWGWSGQYTRETFALGMFTVLVFAMYVFGFLVTIPVYCAAYGLFATRRVFPTLRKRIVFGASSAVVMWGATYEVLNLLHINFIPMVHF